MYIEIRDELDFNDLYNAVWGQACEIMETIEKNDKEDELMNLILESFSDVPTLTEINDFLAYEWEFIFKELCINEDDEEDDE